MAAPGARPSALATGLIWAVWHYPLAFLGYAVHDDRTVSMLLRTVMFVLMQVLLCALYAVTGSVWVTSLAHAGNNTVTGLLSEDLLGGLSSVQVLLCTDVALALVCVPLLFSSVLHRRVPSPVRGSNPVFRSESPVVSLPQPHGRDR